MSKIVTRESFYFFDRSNTNREVGKPVSKEKARMHVENGGDVYTLFKGDARQLAFAAYSDRGLMESPHQYGFFSHYHPGGVHPEYAEGHPKARDTPGHVFFGQRDEIWNTGNNSKFRRKGATK